MRCFEFPNNQIALFWIKFSPSVNDNLREDFGVSPPFQGLNSLFTLITSNNELITSK